MLTSSAALRVGSGVVLTSSAALRVGSGGGPSCECAPPYSPDVDGFLQKVAERKAAEQTQDNRSFLQKYVSGSVLVHEGTGLGRAPHTNTQCSPFTVMIWLWHESQQTDSL